MTGKEKEQITSCGKDDNVLTDVRMSNQRARASVSETESFSPLLTPRDGVVGKCPMSESSTRFAIQTSGLLCDDIASHQDVVNSVVLGSLSSPYIGGMDYVEKAKSAYLFGTPSRWSIDSSKPTADFLRDISDPGLTALASLELSTSLLAKDIGIPKITSVATQISQITGALASQIPASIKELIVPPEMMGDLQTLAYATHKSFWESGCVSEWKLGIVDSASYLVDKQIDWTANLCRSVYGELSTPDLSKSVFKTSGINILSYLPLELEKEKEKAHDITPRDALKNSLCHKLSEKGMRIIEKIVDVNKLCTRKGITEVFKHTDAMLRAASVLSGVICSTREDLGKIIDGLYFMFYENLGRIKKYIPDAEIREKNVFQCIFRVKHIRTDYRHDNEHGSDADIRKKQKDLGESYFHYTGKLVPRAEEDYQNVQIKLYDEFEMLVDYIFSVIDSYKL